MEKNLSTSYVDEEAEEPVATPTPTSQQVEVLIDPPLASSTATDAPLTAAAHTSLQSAASETHPHSEQAKPETQLSSPVKTDPDTTTQLTENLTPLTHKTGTLRESHRRQSSDFVELQLSQNTGSDEKVEVLHSPSKGEATILTSSLSKCNEPTVSHLSPNSRPPTSTHHRPTTTPTVRGQARVGCRPSTLSFTQHLEAQARSAVGSKPYLQMPGRKADLAPLTQAQPKRTHQLTKSASSAGAALSSSPAVSSGEWQTNHQVVMKALDGLLLARDRAREDTRVSTLQRSAGCSPQRKAAVPRHLSRCQLAGKVVGVDSSNQAKAADRQLLFRFPPQM